MVHRFEVCPITKNLEMKGYNENEGFILTAQLAPPYLLVKTSACSRKSVLVNMLSAH